MEILRPDKYADIDALKIGKQVEQFVGERLPSWVKEMVFETGSDAVGDPALWIWVEVDDRAIDGSSLIDVFQPVRRELEQALEKIGVLEQDEEKGGRRITQSGQRDLDRKCSLPTHGLEPLLTLPRYRPDHR